VVGMMRMMARAELKIRRETIKIEEVGKVDE
jgi:hypothetical protein